MDLPEKRMIGRRPTPTYSAWIGLRFRNKGQVCPRWEDFEKFVEDVGRKPTGRSLVRPDKNLLYGPGNWAWATCSERHLGTKNPNYRHGSAMPQGGSRISKTYMVWSTMVKRTTNPNDKAYPQYGGRGIGVCQEWLTFEGFSKDMGEKPDGLTLERVNNDLGYSPENCRWATYKDQARNKRNTVKVMFRGESTTLGSICDTFGIKYASLYYPMRDGYQLETIVTIHTDTMKDAIDKNLPAPQMRAEHKDIAEKMEIEDSVLFDDRAKAKGMQQALRLIGRKGCVRKTERGFRVWRIA